jgi:hypothetical protein
MKIKSASKWVAFLVIATLTVSSCKKKEEPPAEPEPDTEQSTAGDNNLAEVMSNDIESMGSDVADNGSLTTYKTSGEAGLLITHCATVTAANKVITVDFGTTGCVGHDGRTRTGKLIFDYSASSPTTAIRYRHPGFKVTVTSQNYVVDGNLVNIISKTISNTTPTNIPTGKNPGTNLTWAINANISIVKAGNTGTVSWSCSRTKELINTSDSACYMGQATPINWNMAKVKLNGSSSGVNAKGENYTAVAVDVVRDFNCSPYPLHPRRHPFISGTINYTPGSRPARLINYGNGSCDQNATVTINGNTYNITLP